MQANFIWEVNLEPEKQAEVEAKIQDDLRSPHSTIRACHPTESVIVTWGCSDLFLNTIAGNIKCSCGAHIGIINGASDGSTLDYRCL